VARELQTFLTRVELREGPGLPGFVGRELGALLDCGILGRVDHRGLGRQA